MLFEVIVEPVALVDIQEGIDYYDEKLIGLGKDFEDEVNNLVASHEAFFEKNTFRFRGLSVRQGRQASEHPPAKSGRFKSRLSSKSTVINSRKITSFPN